MLRLRGGLRNAANTTIAAMSTDRTHHRFARLGPSHQDAPACPAPPRRVALTALAALLCLPMACSSDEGGGDAGSGGGKQVLHAGPCTTTLIRADGSRVPSFLTWTWDAAGRLLSEVRKDDEASTGFPVWSQTKTWTADGKVATDVYTSTAKAEPNHDWTYTYGANGKPATRKGTQSGYGDEDCFYEHSTEPTQPDDFSLICDFQYDTYDKKGNRTGTVKGRYGQHHTWQDLGEGLRREKILYDDAAGGTPDKELTRYFDAKGRLDRVERDRHLRGYADHIVAYFYDEQDRTARVTTDEGGDGTIELEEKRTYDEAGNLTLQAFDAGADGTVDHRLEHDFGCW